MDTNTGHNRHTNQPMGAATNRRQRHGAKSIWRIIWAASAWMLITVPTIVDAQLLTAPPKDLSRDSKVAIQNLLGRFWPRSLDNRQAASAEFAQAPHDNPTVLLAYVLNRSQQGQTSEALEISGEINMRFPANADAWILSAWNKLISDEYEASLADLNSLAKVLDQGPALAESEQSFVYQRVGRMLEYLNSPLNGAVNDNLLQATIQRFEALNAGQAKPWIAKGRQQVTDKFAQIQQQQADKKQQELAKVEAANEVEAEQLSQRNEQLQQTESRLTPEREAVRAEGNQVISDLEQQASSVLAQLNALNSDGYLLEQDLAYAISDLNFLLQQPPRRRPSTFWIRNRIDSLSYQLNRVRNNAFGVSNQLASIRNQLAAARRQYAGQVESINQEIKQATIQQRRNQNQLAKIARGPQIADGKQSAMDRKKTNLRTYDDLSLELYRQRLLKAIE